MVGPGYPDVAEQRTTLARGREAAAMATVAMVVCGLLVGVMIGISVFGARVLPRDARMPLHYGLGSYNNFASKTAGLIMWPAAGVVVYAIFIAIQTNALKPNHGSSGSAVYILPVVLVLLVIAQVGAIKVAMGTSSRDRMG